MKRGRIKIFCGVILLFLVICDIVINRRILKEQVIHRYKGYFRSPDICTESSNHLITSRREYYNFLSRNIRYDNATRANNGYFIARKTLPRPWTLTTIEYNVSYKNPCFWNAKKLYCLPYFFVGGFPKCGSHELYTKLDFHPDIVKPASKEMNWWTRVQNVKDPQLVDYLKQFRSASDMIQQKPDLITYDASAQTVWDNRLIFPFFNDTEQPDPHELMAHKIHRLIPGAKCVLIVRNPVERLYSDYLYFHWLSHHSKQTKSVRDFHSRVVNATNKFNECLKDPKRSHLRCMYGFVDYWDMLVRLRVGLYIEHVRSWLTAFPANQLLVIRLEEYSQSPVAILQKIFSFLGLKALSEEYIEIQLKVSEAQNTNKEAIELIGPMLNETRELLTQFYKPYNEQLAEMFGDKQFLFHDI